MLAAEAANAILWLGGIFAAAAVHDPLVLVLAWVRAIVAALQMWSSGMLIRRAPAGVSFARLSFLLSAALLVVEIGFRLSPSSLQPGLHVPIVVAYAVYAVTCVGLLRQIG